MMFLTESEAKKKWCPITLGSEAAKCVASECTAWRWSEYTPHVCEKCGSEETVWVDRPDQRHGFCGLSGQPKL